MSWALIPAGHYCLMVLGWTSLIAYIVIMAIILAHRRSISTLRSAFYTMLIAQALPDCLFILDLEYGRAKKYVLIPYYGNDYHSISGAFIFCIQNILKSQICLAYIPFALNRFTAFFAPFKYNNLWRAPLTYSCIAATWLIPTVLNIVYQLQPSVHIDYVYDKLAGVLRMYAGDANNFSAIQVHVTTILSMAVCFPIYAYTIYLARQRALMRSNVTRQDLMHLAFSIISFSTILFDFSRSVMMLIGNINGDSQIVQLSLDLWFYASEITVSVQPWAILATNSLVREIVFRVLRCEWRSKGRRQVRPGIGRTSTPVQNSSRISQTHKPSTGLEALVVTPI